jgi:singapore isolate B (sub-type 7) whole genome shotgun sequence assembly, scaffold_3
MLSSFLAGVVLHVRTADSKDFKERIVYLDPTLLKLNWISISPSKGKIHVIPLEDMTVSVLITG